MGAQLITQFVSATEEGGPATMEMPRQVSGGSPGDRASPDFATLVADPVGFLLEPMSREEFFGSVFEQRPLLNSRGDTGRYASLLSMEDLDNFIASSALTSGMLELTNANNRIGREEYVDDEGNVMRAKVAHEYARGSTIIFPHLHESMFRLGEFCRSLEEVFSCHIQTNIYLTPAGGKGFPPHYDNHDVFVLQLAGSKDWRLYDTPVQTPYRGERFELGVHKANETTQTFTMNAGDCLYLPRGLMHDAETAGTEPSLHITVGLITKTWADLMLEAVSELALEEPAFRRSLPAGYATRDYDREGARKAFASLLELVAGKASMENAFDLMADQFIRGRRPNLSGVILQGPQEGDRFQRRRYAPWNLAEDGEDLVLIGPGGDLVFKPADQEALELALSGEPFSQADIECEDPADLVKRLWSHGYLERLPPQ